MLNDRAAERFGNINQALLQQVTEMDQERRAKAALAHTGDHFIEVDRNGGVTLRMYHHMACGIDIKEAFAPVAD
jgi:hypothetical protein